MKKPRTPAASRKARRDSAQRQNVNLSIRPLHIRPVHADDFAALYALDQACFAPGIAWSKAELAYFLKYPGNIALLAEDEAGRIAGFAIAGRQLRKGAVLGRLITIDVEPVQRRRGV